MCTFEIKVMLFFLIKDTFRKEWGCKWQAWKLRNRCTGLQGPEHLSVVYSSQASILCRQRHFRKLRSGFVLEQRRASPIGLVRSLMTSHNFWRIPHSPHCKEIRLVFCRDKILDALMYFLSAPNTKFQFQKSSSEGDTSHFRALSL